MTEKEKLKNMTFKEKLEYIWDYYHIHIISGVIIIIMSFSLLNALVFNPPADIYAGVVFYNEYLDSTISDKLIYEFDETYVNPEDNLNLFITTLDTTTENMELTVANQQKYVLMLAAKEIDVMVTNPETFEELKIQPSFINLEEVFPKDELEKYNVIYSDVSIDGEKIEPYICGIEKDGYTMGIVINTPRLEHSKEAFLFMLERTDEFSIIN